MVLLGSNNAETIIGVNYAVYFIYHNGTKHTPEVGGVY